VDRVPDLVFAAIGAYIAWWWFGTMREGLRQKVIPTIVISAMFIMVGVYGVYAFGLHGHY
jgi:hypothetical protein